MVLLLPILLLLTLLLMLLLLMLLLSCVCGVVKGMHLACRALAMQCLSIM